MAKRKRVTVRAPTPRDKVVLRGLLRAAGSRDELIKWIDKYSVPDNKGRPKLYPIRDPSISDGPRGTKVVRFSVGPENYVVIADPKPRVPKPRLLKYKKLQPTLREAVGTLETLKGFDPANTALWLIRQLPKGKYRPEED